MKDIVLYGIKFENFKANLRRAILRNIKKKINLTKYTFVGICEILQSEFMIYFRKSRKRFFLFPLIWSALF